MNSSNFYTNPSEYSPKSNSSSETSSVISKYSQLMLVVHEMGQDVRGAYAGNKISLDRLKKGISVARILVHDCLREVEK